MLECDIITCVTDSQHLVTIAISEDYTARTVNHILFGKTFGLLAHRAPYISLIITKNTASYFDQTVNTINIIVSGTRFMYEFGSDTG
jgi:hypothetical protein